ncbi:MAG: S1 RNA-binding domain-containing protein, partial [Nitrospira sp.]|nr:S1 RNA-binding domain-containing protein [Nitrospira sp.]
GAFIDIGVHQDGLVHVSALANRFIKDPHEVVKPGQVVKVKVLDVDLKRQRIGLTMRLDENVTPVSKPAPATNMRQANTFRQTVPSRQSTRAPQPVSAMALALAKAREEKK